MAKTKSTRTPTRHPEWQSAREEQRRLKREAVLKAAAACFNVKGYAGTSLSDIAGRLKMTNASLYYYFKNKEEIAFRCFERGQRIIDECLEQATSEGNNGLERVKRFVQLERRRAVADGPLLAASQLGALHGRHRRAILAGDATHRRALSDLIDAGIEDGSIRSCDAYIAANILLGGLYELRGDLARDRSYEELTEAFANEVVGMLGRGRG